MSKVWKVIKNGGPAPTSSPVSTLRSTCPLSALGALGEQTTDSKTTNKVYDG